MNDRYEVCAGLHKLAAVLDSRANVRVVEFDTWEQARQECHRLNTLNCLTPEQWQAQAFEVLKRIASMNPYLNRYCLFCGQSDYESHKITCEYRRAVELTGGKL